MRTEKSTVSIVAHNNWVNPTAKSGAAVRDAHNPRHFCRRVTQNVRRLLRYLRMPELTRDPVNSGIRRSIHEDDAE